MKFVRLGRYLINVSEILAIEKVNSGCVVYMKSGDVYDITKVSDETFESAIAYICCGG